MKDTILNGDALEVITKRPTQLQPAPKTSPLIGVEPRRKSIQRVSVLWLALMASSPTWAVYQCKDVNGRTSFQQCPCSNARPGEKLNVQPASGHAPTTVETTASPASLAVSGKTPANMTETERLNALSARLAKENRLSTLNNLTIGAVQAEILRVQKRCQSEIEAVRNRKGVATNDVTGAAWTQSLGIEIQAIAVQCDMEQRRLEAELKRYMAEKRDIERELAKP